MDIQKNKTLLIVMQRWETVPFDLDTSRTQCQWQQNNFVPTRQSREEEEEYVCVARVGGRKGVEGRGGGGLVPVLTLPAVPVSPHNNTPPAKQLVSQSKKPNNRPVPLSDRSGGEHATLSHACGGQVLS